MSYLPGPGRFWLVLLSCGLMACGGGSGGTTAPSATASTSEIDFSAASPDASTPAAQTFTATVTSGTTFLAAIPSGEAISKVTYSLSGTTATITVIPSAPTDVGAGTFTGFVTVTAQSCADASCSRLVAGNSTTVNVKYSIPSVVRDVAPYVNPSNTAQTVVIRGRGFSAFAVSNVMFGSTPATSFTVTNDTQIVAAVPALAAGSYAVSVQSPTSPGTVLSTANLVVVDPPAFASTALSYPSAAPAVRKLIYDAERQSLLVAVDSGGGEVLRYTFASGWSTPTVVPVSALQDAALSTDGKTLLTLSDTAVTPLDSVTLTATAAPNTPTDLATGVTLKNLVIANDDTAVLTSSSTVATTISAIYTYPLRTSIFTIAPGPLVLDHATPGISDDGSLGILVQGDSTLTTAPIAYQYTSVSHLFSATALTINQNSIAPVVSRNGGMFVLNGIDVYSSLSVLLGTLPTTTLAVVIKPDSTRAYTYDSAAAAILSFDLVNTTGTDLTQVGSAVALPADPGAGVKLAISPDGGTLFLAGSNQIVIVPTPP